MIVSTVNGDLIKAALEGRYFGIAHGANCQNTMKSGIAPQICKEWPDAGRVDQGSIKGDRSKLGGFTQVYDITNKLYIFNLYTQYTWTGRKQGKRDLDYRALAGCFSRLNRHYYYEEKPLGIPMIGAGLAGGDWEAIQTIINLATPDLDIEVVFLQ